jgi:hypothetical protein
VFVTDPRCREVFPTDCTDNHPLVDQWNAASRRNDSIEREQIVEMHKLDTVLDDLRWPPEGHGCSRLVLRKEGNKPKEIICLEVPAYIAALDYAS